LWFKSQNMKKLKLKFKRALFAFFKEEILNSVGWQGNIQQTVIVTKELKFTEIKAEILLNDTGTYMHNEPIGIVYEKALELAKEKLFNQSMKFIQIENESIMNSHIYPHRAIRLSLFIGSNQTER
jgi:hypothetical protein